MPDRFVAIATVSGRPEAEMIQSYLRALDIQCELAQEAAARVEGLTVGPLAEVEILVPSKQRRQASEAIKQFRGARGG